CSVTPTATWRFGGLTHTFIGSHAYCDPHSGIFMHITSDLHAYWFPLVFAYCYCPTSLAQHYLFGFSGSNVAPTFGSRSVPLSYHTSVLCRSIFPYLVISRDYRYI